MTNEGPSFLPKTYVNITIPLSEKDKVFAKIVVMSHVFPVVHFYCLEYFVVIYVNDFVFIIK